MISNWNKLKIAILFFGLSVTNVSGQTVTTFLTGSGLNGPDGIAFDASGNLYVANWGGGSGTKILKIDQNATVTIYNSTCNAPDGLVFDQSGNIYISNYNSGIIDMITPDGVKSVFASGLNKPSALVFDKDENLYVSNYGGNSISKITPDGTISTFASGLNAPIGLAFDPDENLYVSNYNNGVINKITPEGIVSVFATVPNPSYSKIQYLVRAPSGSFYLPAYGHNKIYEISPFGEVSIFAGTGVAGGYDGVPDSAQFNGPNSIALNSDGDLYITEYNANRIRIIKPAESTGASEENFDKKPFKSILENIPNPFNEKTTIYYGVNTSGNVQLRIYDASGSVITSETKQIPANEKQTFEFYPENLCTGIYFSTIWINGEIINSKKMILIK